MIEQLETLNAVLAYSGLFLGIATLVLLADLLYTRKLYSCMHRYGILISFLISAFGTVIALIYSEWFGLIPCGLCWFERVMLFPQVITTITSVRYRDIVAARSGIALSAIGLVISLYHHYIQMGGSEFVRCPTGGADCTKRFLFEFGFMTFPLLAAISFAALIAVYVYVLRTNSAQKVD
jgi:disulfide bond formation protein DsbB